MRQLFPVLEKKRCAVMSVETLMAIIIIVVGMAVETTTVFLALVIVLITQYDFDNWEGPYGGWVYGMGYSILMLIFTELMGGPKYTLDDLFYWREHGMVDM